MLVIDTTNGHQGSLQTAVELASRKVQCNQVL